MRTIAIPQLYCGASGKKGAYNRQEVGLARAFAALGCRAVVLYPDPDAAPEAAPTRPVSRHPPTREPADAHPKASRRVHNVHAPRCLAKPAVQ